MVKAKRVRGLQANVNAIANSPTPRRSPPGPPPREALLRTGSAAPGSARGGIGIGFAEVLAIQCQGLLELLPVLVVGSARVVVHHAAKVLLAECGIGPRAEDEFVPGEVD